MSRKKTSPVRNDIDQSGFTEIDGGTGHPVIIRGRIKEEDHVSLACSIHGLDEYLDQKEIEKKINDYLTSKGYEILSLSPMERIHLRVYTSQGISGSYAEIIPPMECKKCGEIEKRPSSQMLSNKNVWRFSWICKKCGTENETYQKNVVCPR